jgi:hypothetical protein
LLLKQPDPVLELGDARVLQPVGRVKVARLQRLDVVCTEN